MKILESYLAIAESLFIEAEIDDEEMIKYKDKDGESKEMKAGSAKTMAKDHPAKIEYDKMADKGGEEEPKGKGLGKGDFERDFDDGEPEDKPHGGDTGTDADAQGEPPEGSREPDDVDDVDIKSIKQKVDDKGTDDAAQKSMEGIPRKSEKWNNIDGDWADLSTALENDDEEMLKQVLDDMEPESRKVFDQEFGADSQGSEEPSGEPADEPKEKQPYTNADGKFDKDAANNEIGPASQWGANYNPFTKSLNDKEFDRYTKSREDGMSHTDAFRVAEHPSPEEQYKQLDKEINALQAQGKEADSEGDSATAKELYKTAQDLRKKKGEIANTLRQKKSESITIDGKKYRPIKESKQHIFKEIYDRTFRSLK